MNYLLALMYMGTMVMVATALGESSRGMSSFRESSNRFRLSLSALVTLLIGEFVLLSNGFQNLMEM